jgi:hypothetical protein
MVKTADDKKDKVMTFRCKAEIKALLKTLSAKLTKEYGVKVSQSDVIEKAVRAFSRKQ